MRPKSAPAKPGSVAARRSGAVVPATAARGLAVVRRAVEPLEQRLLLSVTRDANGFSVVTPSGTSLVYYVSSIYGKDDGTFNGLSPGTPFKSISKAKTTLEGLNRNGSPDEILLRRGDVFAEAISNWKLSGQSADDPFLIGAYTDPSHISTARPKINSGRASGFATQVTGTVPPINHLVIQGVSFEADSRNYRQPIPDKFNTSYFADAQGGTDGINVLGPMNDFLVEDCSFQYYRVNVAIQSFFGAISNVTVRRSQILDAYAPNVDANGATTTVTSEGLYADGVAGLKLEDNVFDHNGWVDNNGLGCVASIFNHSAYLNTGNSDVVVTGNIFANSASHGLQARAGGIITNNLFLKNPIAMSYGYVNGAAKVGGVFGEVAGNVVIDDNSINGAVRGWGLEIGNLKPISQGGGTVVHDNLYFTDSQNAWPAIQLTIGAPSGSTSNEVGINDLTIRNNTVYGWAKGISINPAFVGGGNGSTGLNHVVIQNNDFQRSLKTPIVDHASTFNASAETWQNNRYSAISSDSGSTQWFKLGSTLTNLAGWQAAVEPTATAMVLTYPFLQDPGGNPRSVATYNSSVGGAATLDAFLTEEKRQTSQFWRSSYSSGVVGTYIKRGFDIGGPSAALTASDLSDGGAPTVTFSVVYSDNDQINLSSIDGTDVLVTGPNGYSQAGSLVGVVTSASGAIRTATYSVPAPNGTVWDSTGNGVYAVTLQVNAVKDAAGNFSAGGALGQFNVSIDPAKPTAQLSATNVTQPSASATLTVTYTASGTAVGAVSPGNAGFETPVLGGSLGSYQYTPAGATWDFADDAGISGNNTPLTTQSPNAPQGQQVGFLQDTGSISQDIGGWMEGSYLISIKALQRQAATSNQRIAVFVDGQLVSTIVPSGSTYATYSSGVFDVSAGTHTITLQGTQSTSDIAFIDDIRIRSTDSSGTNDMDTSTFGTGDLFVTGPNGFTGTALYTSAVQSGAGWAATYLVNPPAGGWTTANNGPYTVSSVADEVLDTAGTAVPAGPLGTFAVSIAAVMPPTATVSAPTITVASSSAETFTVIYADDTGINSASIVNGNLQILGPNNFVGSVTAGSQVVIGTSLAVTYSLAAPAGAGWLATNNGVYSIVAQSAQPVTDTTGIPLAAGVIGTFEIKIDGSGPIAWEKVGTVSTPVTSGPTIVVTMSDDTGIDTSRIDNLDLAGTRTDNAITVGAVLQSVSVKATNPANGAPTLLDATYAFTPPGGKWQVSSNGVYNIFLKSGQVADVVTPQNFNGSQYLGTFTVVLETVPPTVAIAAVTPSPRTTPVTSTTITFSEAVSGFDLADLSLTRDGGANLLTGAQTVSSSDGGKTWTLSDLSGLTAATGNYTLSLTAAGSGIVDLAGNALSASTSTSWITSPIVVQSVTVDDGTTQRSMVSSLTVVFSSPASFASGAFVLQQRGGAAVTVNAANPNGDGITWNLTFSAAGVEASGSLADGVYDFAIVGSNVHAGSPTGPAMLSNYSLTFHRLFGDFNGDKIVNNSDNFRFNAAYLKNRGETGYQSAFDYNNSGNINNIDTFQFSKRYLVSVSYT